MGDAIYEVAVRRRLLAEVGTNTNALQRAAVKYVSAGGQATAMKGLFNGLTEEEQALVKRARNHKSATRPKNQDPVDYKWATALEALLGFLYLVGEEGRAQELSQKAMTVIDGQDEK